VAATHGRVRLCHRLAIAPPSGSSSLGWRHAVAAGGQRRGSSS
jgi:hypothetical protein